VSDYPSALALVEVGIGVCLVPESQEKSAPSGVVLRGSSALAMSAELWLVQRRGSGPLADEMVRILRAGVAGRPARSPPRRARSKRPRQR
jgi:hypothetical protein